MNRINFVWKSGRLRTVWRDSRSTYRRKLMKTRLTVMMTGTKTMTTMTMTNDKADGQGHSHDRPPFFFFFFISLSWGKLNLFHERLFFSVRLPCGFLREHAQILTPCTPSPSPQKIRRNRPNHFPFHILPPLCYEIEHLSMALLGPWGAHANTHLPRKITKKKKNRPFFSHIPVLWVSSCVLWWKALGKCSIHPKEILWTRFLWMWVWIFTIRLVVAKIQLREYFENTGTKFALLATHQILDICYLKKCLYFPAAAMVPPA